MKEQVSVDEECVDKIIYILDGKGDTYDANVIRTLYFQYQRLKRLDGNVKKLIEIKEKNRDDLKPTGYLQLDKDIRLLKSLYDENFSYEAFYDV